MAAGAVVLAVILRARAEHAGLAYVINYAIVARDGASVASTVTYLLPVVAVVLGAAVLDETIGPITLAGTAIVLLGIALVRRRPTEASTERSNL